MVGRGHSGATGRAGSGAVAGEGVVGRVCAVALTSSVQRICGPAGGGNQGERKVDGGGAGGGGGLAACLRAGSCEEAPARGA